MAKNKIACALSAAAVLGSGILAPAAFAEGDDPFCIDGGDCYSTLQAAFDQVPSDGTPTTIYLDSNEDVVYDGGGAFYTAGKGAHPANGNYNVVFDLKGKTYVIQKDPVGSTGYETQAFHLERGGKFTFKDGTVKAASGSGVWFILQNYADTVLDNVILDGSDNSGITYVASNNFGSLTVKGNSQILASEGKVAFDLWYGMSSVYDGGITVTFGDDFTGKVVGKVEYGRHNRVTDSDWREKAVLNISNGDFDIAFQNGSTGALNGANINISGGKFSVAPSIDYVAGGYDLYSLSDDGPWVVDLATEEKDQAVSIELGKTATIELSDIAKKYATMGSVDNGIATVDNNGVITAKAAGKTAILVQMHDSEEEEYKVDVVVYEIGNDDADVHTEVVSTEKKKEELVAELGEDVVESIKEAVGDAEVAGYFEIAVNLVDNEGGSYGQVDEFGSMVLVTVNVPENIDGVAEGYARKYYVIRYHDGKTTKIEAIDNGDGTISFENDKFSTFALIYVDEEEEEEPAAATPETGTVTAAGASASVAALMTAVAVGILTSIVSFAYFVRRKD